MRQRHFMESSTGVKAAWVERGGLEGRGEGEESQASDFHVSRCQMSAIGPA